MEARGWWMEGMRQNSRQGVDQEGHPFILGASAWAAGSVPEVACLGQRPPPPTCKAEG